jgi:two-component system phosphate regulon response regulator PhoB
MHAWILVCDDEAHIRHIIAHKLRAVGFNVAEARDGAEAKALLDPGAKEPLRPNLIITDYQMPQVTGLELCMFLKARPDTAKTPVLMLTARGYSLSKEDLAQTNIQQVISKPFGVKLLLERVAQVLLATCPDMVPPAARNLSKPDSNAGPLAA